MFFLQHITDLGDLLGEDLASQKYVAALTLAFKSFRCFHLSESYVGMKKWAEAYGLLDRALEHVTQSLEQYRSLEQGATSVTVKIDQEKVSERATISCPLANSVLVAVSITVCSPFYNNL